MNSHPYAKYIWDYFVAKIGNEKGVAGLMGNLRAESGLYPDRVEGDIPYSSYSKNYTAQVDSGAISEYSFVNDAPDSDHGKGYGLAQWTYYSRKQALYDLYKSGNYDSIGSVKLACDYLWIELQQYYIVLNVLKTASTIRQASDCVLHDFENPADQSTAVEQTREALGQEVYDAFSGSSPDTPDNPDNPDIPFPNIERKKLSKLLLMAIAIDND